MKMENSPSTSAIWGDDGGEVGELVSGGLVDELAEAARKHGVMITISVSPYEEEADTDGNRSAGDG